MKSLGYSSTWATTCFINGGCGARVFAHTSGQGDFVLFDDLGWPWPVHDCYLNRYRSIPAGGEPRKGSSMQSVVLSSLLAAARSSSYCGHDGRGALCPSVPGAQPRSNITRIEPRVGMPGGTLTVVGFVADVHERYRPRELRTLGTFGEQIAAKVIGTRSSQITVVNNQLESFTALADLSREVVAKGDSVSVDLRLGSVLAFPLFLCDRVERLSVGPITVGRTWKESKYL